MKNSLQIGRLFGIPVQFHWSFLLVGIWLVYDSWRPDGTFNWDNFQWLGIWVGMVFLAVLLHELGHALVARRWGIATERIVLYPIGGGAFLEQPPEEPGQEISIALAGPAVNLALAALIAPVIWYGGNDHLPRILQLFLHPSGNIVVFDAAWWEYLIVVFFVLNLLLGAFNLLPAFPLDGGRVLRALLSKQYSRTRATVLAGRAGMWGAVLLLAIGVYLNDYLFMVGAVFIFVLAGVEINVQRRREKLAATRVSRHLRTDFHRLYLTPQLTLAELRDWIADRPEAPVLLLDRWQQPHGVTTRAALLDADLDDRVHETVEHLLGDARWQGLHPDETMLAAAEKMDRYPFFAFPVVDNQGRVVGLLDRQAVEAVLNAKK